MGCFAGRLYLFRPESLFTSCSNVRGINNYCGVLLEVGWGENCREHQVESLVPVCLTTNVPGLKVSSGVNLHHGQLSARQ